jgi:hypothetical protein
MSTHNFMRLVALSLLVLGSTASAQSPFDSAQGKPVDSAQGRPFDSAQGRPSGLEIPCLGTVPFDPELARLCDTGIPLTELPETPVGRALEHVAQQLLDSLESTTSASAHGSRELRPDKEPRR